MQVLPTFAINFLFILSLSTTPNYGFHDKTLKPEVRPEGILQSYANLYHCARKEEAIYVLSQIRLQNIKHELNTLKEFVEDYASAMETATNHAKISQDAPKKRIEIIASSGIASYRMTYRYVHTLHTLKEQMAARFLDTELVELLWNKRPPQSKEELETEYKKRLAGEILTEWPNRIDLAVALESLIHIQEVYNVDYEELPSMLAPDTEDPPELNAFHSARIGLHALRKEYYASAVEWIELAILKVGSGLDLSIPLSSLEAYLELTGKAHNEMLEFANKSGNVSHENLFVKVVKPFRDFGDLSRERVSDARAGKFVGKSDPEFASVTYNGLCSGYDFQSRAEIAVLKCWYDTKSSPIRTILPLKKELISAKPEIVQHYDFIGAKMIKKILSLPKDCFSPSGIPRDAFFIDKTRTKTVRTCILQENNLPELEKKIEILTRTDLSEQGSIEGFQFVESTYGKIISPQKDPIYLDVQPELSVNELTGESTHSLISVHIFLDDIPYGGLTAFTSAGASATPVRGSALVWTTAHTNGTARRDTTDTSCPVTFGYKQVLTNVIRYYPQFRTYPCRVPKKSK